MSAVQGLGYFGLTSTAVKEWSALGSDLLGAQVEEVGDDLRVRLDERTWRLNIAAGERDDLEFVGWEVAGQAELDALVESMRRRGHEFAPGSALEHDSRDVAALVVGRDPDGNRVEIFHSASVAATAFRSPLHKSFVTGHLGAGHLVLYCFDIAAMLAYYVDALGMRVTDTIRLGTDVLYFLRCNARHHSLALMQGRREAALQHIMMEVDSVDAVGSAFERCSAAGVAQSSLGRHTNDEMLSFYALAPGGYTIEYGYGGRVITESEHRGAIYESTSWWGHRDLLPSRG